MDRDVTETVISQNPRPLQAFSFSSALCLLVLAPHPDDFDAIGVTMRFFIENGNPLYVAVATSGVNGVEDSFCSPPTPAVKRKIREEEQRASCRFCGLPEPNLVFLRLEQDQNGRLAEKPANIDRIRRYFLNKRPQIVFLPHRHDPNLTHQQVYAMFQQVAREAAFPLAVFLNRDPKTIQLQCHVYMGFDERTAAWKGKLLRFHRSQQQRNLDRQGYGIDERILGTDRQSAAACALDAPYAEVFELEFFGAAMLEEILTLNDRKQNGLAFK